MRPTVSSRSRASALRRFVPLLDWSRSYTRETLSNDLIAAVIVTIICDRGDRYLSTGVFASG